MNVEERRVLFNISPDHHDEINKDVADTDDYGPMGERLMEMSIYCQSGQGTTTTQSTRFRGTLKS